MKMVEFEEEYQAVDMDRVSHFWLTADDVTTGSYKLSFILFGGPNNYAIHFHNWERAVHVYKIFKTMTHSIRSKDISIV